MQKIKAAVDCRTISDLQIIARTDARAVHGIDAAIDRAHAFVEAGADVIFVEAPVDMAEIARIAARSARAAGRQHRVRRPDARVPREQLADMGFSVVLYANAALQAALKSVREVSASLNDEGSLDSVRDRLASFEERQRSVDKDAL